jgi:hypothetical protein
MKSLAIAIVLALGVSAPALAQQAASPPANATDAGLIDEDLILEATTQEDRAMLLRRCAGPPPRPIASAATPKETPMSEPAVVVERAAATPSTAG